MWSCRQQTGIDRIRDKKVNQRQEFKGELRSRWRDIDKKREEPWIIITSGSYLISGPNLLEIKR